MYRPAIVSARMLTQLPLGNGTATLLTDVEPAGLIQYGLIMEFCDEVGIPCFYVAAEVNELNQMLGGGSHFLCSYIGGEHRNHGSSDDWTDPKLFTKGALDLYRKQFGNTAT